MLASRSDAFNKIRIAEQQKTEAEDAIVTHMLRCNDHRFLSINWRKLDREVYKETKA